jgi:Zn-dependent protease
MPPARDHEKPASGGWGFHVLGFRVSVPWNALIGIAVIAVLWLPEFSRTPGSSYPWLSAGVFAILLTVSILLHELAHALSARAFGYHVTGVTLWAMGGYTTYRTSERHGPVREATIAIAGPAATLAVAAIAWAMAPIFLQVPIVWDILRALAVANLFIGVFNLLPGSPLDGGAIVKSGVWAMTGSQTRGQVVAAWIGRGLAVLLAIAPFILAARQGNPPSLTMIVISLVIAGILWSGASSSLKSAHSNESLMALSAGEITQPMLTVPAASSLDSLGGHLKPDLLIVAIDSRMHPVGVMSPAAAAAVPASERARLDVLAVSTRVDGLPTVAATDTAMDVLRTCQENDARFVAVVENGMPIGLIDTDTVFVMEGP